MRHPDLGPARSLEATRPDLLGEWPLVVEDLDSANGSYINRQRIAEPVEMTTA